MDLRSIGTILREGITIAVIKAKGKFIGTWEELVCRVKGSKPTLYTKEGELVEDELMLEVWNRRMSNPPAIGGTYYPPLDSMLSAYAVLQKSFFDYNAKVDIEVEGDIGEIPTYPEIKGIVY